MKNSLFYMLLITIIIVNTIFLAFTLCQQFNKEYIRGQIKIFQEAETLGYAEKVGDDGYRWIVEDRTNLERMNRLIDSQ